MKYLFISMIVAMLAMTVLSAPENIDDVASSAETAISVVFHKIV